MFRVAESRAVESQTPLLRQIESLQRMSDARAEGWRDVERSLLRRAAAAEAGVTRAESERRAAEESAAIVESRFETLETAEADARRKLEEIEDKMASLQKENKLEKKR